MSDSSSSASGQYEHLKEELEEYGLWKDEWEPLLELDPAYLESYVDLVTHPWKTGTLDPKVREFVSIAVYSAATHLNEEGTRFHVGNALDHGATVEEIVEVFEVAAVLGSHTISTGVETLIAEHGRPELTDEARTETEALKERLEGYWPDVWDDVAAFDHQYLEHFVDASSQPWQDPSLSSEVKELLYIAIDVSTTHLHTSGLGFHVNNALENTDVTPEEIMEVYQIVSDLGMDTLTHGVPILVEEAEKRGKLPENLV